MSAFKKQKNLSVLLRQYLNYDALKGRMGGEDNECVPCACQRNMLSVLLSVEV
jgi:hypothetical protein